MIILVVLGHSIQETLKDGCFDNHLWNYIYSFHMPAFMAVSGLLACHTGAVQKTGGRLSTIYRRFQQLLVPFFLWSLIKWVVYQHCEISLLPNIVLYPDRYFWFLWVLFFIAVFFQLGDWLSEKLKIKQEVVVLGIGLLFAVLMVVADIRIFGFQFLAYYYIFYIIGYYLYKYNGLVTTKTRVLYFLAAVWAIMAWVWKMHELPSFFYGFPFPHTLMQYIYRFATALIAVYVLIGLCPKLLNKEKKWNMPFANLGYNSLGIYVVHLMLMPVIVKGISLVLGDLSVVIALAFVAALMTASFIVQLLSQWKVTNKLLLGKI